MKISLFYKIPTMVLLLLILSIGVTTFLSIRDQTKTISFEVIDKNKFISMNLASSIQGAFWSLNWIFVEKQMEEVCKTEDVTFLELVKPNGEVYLFSGDAEFKNKSFPSDLLKLDNQTLKEWSNSKTGRSHKLIITPIKVGDAQWTLFTGLSLSAVEKAKVKILRTTIMWSCGIFLLGGCFSFILTRRMVKPIQQLVEGTKEIGKGHLGHRIDIKSRDEIGALADSFNQMAQNLEKTTISRDKMAIEIKERKQAEKALRESEKKYRSIFNNAQVGISRSSIKDGTFIEANDTIARLFGYKDREDILASKYRAAENYVDPGIRDNLLANLDAHGEFKNFNARLYRKDKSVAWFRYSGKVYPEEGYIEIVATDISEEKTLEEKLLQAKKMEAIGTLAGGVAHDLNNILSGLVSYPELLLLDMPQESPLRRAIQTILDSGKKAAKIVEDLLTLARRGVALTEVINLNDVINDYFQSPEYDKLITFHSAIEIKIDLDPDLLNIMGSPVHLFKSIMNLVSNAAEAIPGTGKILISTTTRHLDRPVQGYQNVQEGDYVLLSVTDSGIGMSEEDLARIFEPFYTKKTMGRSGTGLGMTVVWGTVQDHKGYIDIKSAAGSGTRIDIFFPVTRKEPVKKGASVTIDELMGQGRILVVDDIEEQRKIASDIMTRLGYSVFTLSSGEEAVEYLKNESVDLVILDMIMDPGMDGLDTYRRILELHPGQKAIIASGYSKSERAEEALKFGAGQYIKKPYTLEKIGAAVKSELSAEHISGA